MVGGIITLYHTMHPHIFHRVLEEFDMVELAPWVNQGGSTAWVTVVPCHGSTVASTAPTTVFPLDRAVVGTVLSHSTTAGR